jgi:hypothetical protein
MEELMDDEITNIAVKENGIRATDWGYRDLSELLYAWFNRFNERFFENLLKTPVISFERTRINTLGHFVIDRNPFGLKWNINLNRLYVGLPLVDILSILLHEQIHLWQQEFGKKKGKNPHNNYHNKEFRLKAKLLGIPSNESGMTLYYQNPFLSFLRDHGVRISSRFFRDKEVKQMRSSKSKLKKWSCGCTNVRVAIPDFRAKCLKEKCGNQFELVGK